MKYRKTNLALKVQFTHLALEEQVISSVALPEDFKAAILFLRKYSI